MPSLSALHLNGLRAVEAVARCGSLAKAGDELGVSASAVSQQINRTEAQLGRALFERTPAGLRATAFGRAFAARLAAGFREIEAAVALADRSAGDAIVVSVAPAFASKWLLPRLDRHFERHPEVLVRIDATTRLVDLDHSDVDVAIRLGDGDWSDVLAEPLLAQDMFPVCAPKLAGRLHSIADLADLWVITNDNPMVTWPRWFEAAGHPPVTMRPGARFSDPMLCLDAVVAGHGIMMGWQLLVADALADGRLVAPFGARAASGLGYWMVGSRVRRDGAAVRDFKRWLRAECATTDAAFGSQPGHGVPAPVGRE